MMKSKEQLLEYVSKVCGTKKNYLLDLFRYIPEAVVKEMVYTTVKKDEHIVLAGEPNETVYFILQGNVIGFDFQKMGQVYSFMDFTNMYVIGDFEIFGNCSEYLSTVLATEECSLLKISSENYLQWVKHDENALYLRLQNIMQTLTFERQFEREFIHMSCKERMASYLAKYYENNVKEKFGEVKVNKTQSELSDKVGYNIRSVQRGIASLKKENILSNERGKITITYEQYLKLSQYIDQKGRK